MFKNPVQLALYNISFALLATQALVRAAMHSERVFWISYVCLMMLYAYAVHVIKTRQRQTVRRDCVKNGSPSGISVDLGAARQPRSDWTLSRSALESEDVDYSRLEMPAPIG